MAEAYEVLADRLDERRRTADEGQGEIVRCDFREQLPVYTPAVAGPSFRLDARERVDDLEAVRRHVLQLLAIDDVVPAARGVQESRPNCIAVGGTLPHHRHQRHDP
jgi:hypothetical protein